MLKIKVLMLTCNYYSFTDEKGNLLEGTSIKYYSKDEKNEYTVTKQFIKDKQLQIKCPCVCEVTYSIVCGAKNVKLAIENITKISDYELKI